MDISLLIDCPQATAQIAKWYFDEWAHKDPTATEQSVADKVAMGATRDRLPLAFVLYSDNQLAGVAEIKYREVPELSGYTHWLDGVYVPPEHRGKGISTRLIEFAKKIARELNISVLHLSCEAHNVALYERQGFSVVNALNNRYIMEYRSANPLQTASITPATT